MVLAPPAPLARLKRVTHPEDRLRRAAPRAAEFRFPSVWKRTENKPGRQRSPRASGFLEDTAASPEKAAAPGTPRRNSHFFSVCCAASGAARPVDWSSGGCGGRDKPKQDKPSGCRRRPVTQQHARETQAHRRPPRQRPHRLMAMSRSAEGKRCRGGLEGKTSSERPEVERLRSSGWAPRPREQTGSQSAGS